MCKLLWRLRAVTSSPRRRRIGALWLTLSASVLLTELLAAEPNHWAFRRLHPAPLSDLSAVREREAGSAIDVLINRQLSAVGLHRSAAASRRVLIRRLTLDLTGLPPTSEEVQRFLDDEHPLAYERLVDCLLASPHYGVRWGKYWLDAAGYADSNGYFQADTDRPLAYRYRDWVIRALNADKPFDAFVREQLAGDELAGIDPHAAELQASDEQIEWLEATHFLRNGPDGSGESDGNPDEVRADRYYALEASQQILASSLFGLTVQCAKCHDHKFEDITQQDYYRLQAVLYPVFHIEKWKKPNERVVQVARPGELDRWRANEERVDNQIAALRNELHRRLRGPRPKFATLFEDLFEGPAGDFLTHWSNTAPGDDAPGGTAVVALLDAEGQEPQPTDASVAAPAAIRQRGVLRIVEGGANGDKWLVTKTKFDWTPDNPQEWVQASFDLVASQLEPSGTPAARIAFFIAAHDFNDNGTTRGGNILLDGNPAGGAAVFVDYPGRDEKHVGTIGKSGYTPLKNFGVRVTNVGNGKFRLEQLVDGIPEEPALQLAADDLPDGAFGFEYCCGRSFIVDNVRVESSRGRQELTPEQQAALKEYVARLERERQEHVAQVKSLEAQRFPKPGKLSLSTEINPELPVVRQLLRGNPATPGEVVQPGVLRALDDDASGRAGSGLLQLAATSVGANASAGAKTSGRRLALARWATDTNSRPAALMARVQANRLWLHHFGRGLVATPDNLGESGADPSHPDLLEYLASEFVRSGWSMKALHRAVVCSDVYRQSSVPTEAAVIKDPDNQWLSHFTLRRLDAEALRDSWLALSGELETQQGGPYTPTPRIGTSEVSVNEQAPGAFRRSVYLQQRRTQVLSVLGLFDAPSIVFNCVQRPTTTMPLQSLSLLNSEFALARAKGLMQRVRREESNVAQHLPRLFERVTGRAPTDEEAAAIQEFLTSQTREYGSTPPAIERAWNEVAQMLLASNALLYVE